MAQTTLLSDELGLRGNGQFLRGAQFWLALLAGWIVAQQLPPPHFAWSAVLPMLLWQPLWEELLFRGVLQGQLQRRLSGWNANIVTSVLFALAHLAHHTPFWAAATFVPSLLFGYFRLRDGHLYPALTLHIAYNAFYLYPR